MNGVSTMNVAAKQGGTSISLCMIVRNEEKHLPGCLAATSDLVDEIVVVDTGSEDRTREVARAYGAHVHEFPWCDDFAEARNESLRHAKGPWIFWMDADDRLPPESRAKLRQLFASLPEENVAYLMNVTSAGPDDGPMFETQHARLFRNDPRHRWHYAIHEQIVPSVLRAGGRLLDTDIEVVHVGYTPRALEFKVHRNLRLVDVALERAPLDAHLLSCRAVVLADLGRNCEALVALNLCEAAYSRRPPPPSLAVLRARAHAGEGDLEGALESVRSGIELYPINAQLLCLQAEILAAMGRYDDAEIALRAQLIVGEQHERFSYADRTIVAVRVPYLLAELLLAVGRFDEAQREADALLGVRPAFGFAWLTLAESTLRAGDFRRFEVIVAKLGMSEETEIARLVLRAARHRQEGEPHAALYLVERALAARPKHVALRTARVEALFDAGERGDVLTNTISEALASNPLCMRIWAIRRACALGRPVASAAPIAWRAESSGQAARTAR
jgi:tetratricopeptide (TPR) repeat protein